MRQGSQLAAVLLVGLLQFAWMTNVYAQSTLGPSDTNDQTHTMHDHRGDQIGEGQERLPDQGNNSEFNHHVAGVCDVLFGLAELGVALQYPMPIWIRFVLPSVLGVIGLFMLVWSHHEAWPIGSVTFTETFFGQNQEIVEHKFYGVLAIAIAFCESLRRTGRGRHPVWAAPLVFLMLVASLLLFVHSHGDHPAAAKIEFHHTVLGTVGVAAAFSKGMASWFPGAYPRTVKRWEVAWATSVILFGLLLLVYSE